MRLPFVSIFVALSALASAGRAESAVPPANASIRQFLAIRAPSNPDLLHDGTLLVRDRPHGVWQLNRTSPGGARQLRALRELRPTLDLLGKLGTGAVNVNEACVAAFGLPEAGHGLASDPALLLLARIVNGADTDNALWNQPESAGLRAVAWSSPGSVDG